MKIMKSRIFAFVLGALIFSSISVYAARKYYASDIEYKETTLDKALDTLYTKTNTYKNLTEQTTATAQDIVYGKTVYDNNGTLLTGTYNTTRAPIFGKAVYDEKYGNGDSAKTASLNLSTGNYIVVVTNNYGWHSANTISTISTEKYEESEAFKNNMISCTNCQKTFLSGYINHGTSTVMATNVSRYSQLSSTNAVYYVEMSSSGIVSISSTINAEFVRHSLTLSAIPVS